MTDTPRTDFVAHESGDAEWNRFPNKFGRMTAHAQILERELAATKLLLVEAREEGRLAGLREAKEIINNLTKNRTKEDFYPDAYDCRDAITRAAEGK